MDLHNMFSLIQKYHVDLGYDTTAMTLEECMQHFRNMGLAANQELSELVDSAPWKPWRKAKDQELDVYNATMEAIDTIFFLVGMLECLAVHPDDFEQMFRQKLNENYDRIRRGYNNKPEERR